MAIDEKSRQILYLRQFVSEVVQSLQEIKRSIDSTSTQNESFKRSLVESLQKNTQEVFSKSLYQTQTIFASLEDKLKSLTSLFQKLDKPTEVTVKVDKVDIGNFDKLPQLEIKNFPKQQEFPKIKFPDLYKVTGDVNANIESLPPVSISNFQEMLPMFERLNSAFLILAQRLKIEIPDKVKIKDPVEILNWNDLLDGIEELKKGFNLLINKEKGGIAKQVEVTNFPIPKIPQPVTNISLNALKGVPLSSQISVLSTPTLLPANNLANRRTLIIYNNSSQTVWIGGSGVTVAAGFPILKGQYSPPIDAGANMSIYGIAASSAECRVLEVSDIAIGR